jgi:hypothetical protein
LKKASVVLLDVLVPPPLFDTNKQFISCGDFNSIRRRMVGCEKCSSTPFFTMQRAVVYLARHGWGLDKLRQQRESRQDVFMWFSVQSTALYVPFPTVMFTMRATLCARFNNLIKRESPGLHFATHMRASEAELKSVNNTWAIIYEALLSWRENKIQRCCENFIVSFYDAVLLIVASLVGAFHQREFKTRKLLGRNERLRMAGDFLHHARQLFKLTQQEVELSYFEAKVFIREERSWPCAKEIARIEFSVWIHLDAANEVSSSGVHLIENFSLFLVRQWMFDAMETRSSVKIWSKSFQLKYESFLSVHMLHPASMIWNVKWNWFEFIKVLLIAGMISFVIERDFPSPSNTELTDISH